jgi:urease accessory protein
MRRVVAIHRKGAWPGGEERGTVTLGFLDRHRRRVRLHDDDGTPFLLDLPRAAVLGAGDGLELDGGGYLRVCAAFEELAEIACRDGAELARIAWHLGNRHLPMQVVGTVLRIRWDHVIVNMVAGLGAEVSRISAPFDPEAGAYAETGHGHHHHDHEHDDGDGHAH